ncbi:dihydrofolate reductase [Thermoproteota archaeon]
MKFTIIAALDPKNGIGYKNTIPWSLSADMRHFKTITTSVSNPDKHNAVIMGRATWDSLRYGIIRFR